MYSKQKLVLSFILLYSLFTFLVLLCTILALSRIKSEMMHHYGRTFDFRFAVRQMVLISLCEITHATQNYNENCVLAYSPSFEIDKDIYEIMYFVRVGIVLFIAGSVVAFSYLYQNNT